MPKDLPLPYKVAPSVETASRRFQFDDVLLLAEQRASHEPRKILGAIPDIAVYSELLVENRGEHGAIPRFQIVIKARLCIIRLRLAQPVVVSDGLNRSSADNDDVEGGSIIAEFIASSHSPASLRGGEADTPSSYRPEAPNSPITANFRSAPRGAAKTPKPNGEAPLLRGFPLAIVKVAF